MHFLGGPPPTGQITDTVHVEPAAGRHVRVDRNRVGTTGDRTCELDAPDDAVWRAFVSALADPDLEAAFAHPDRVPGLVIDAGYFSCAHAGARVAISDVQSDAHATEETRAVRRLAGAYTALHDATLAMPACNAL
jgi:hypothetical protein